MPGSKDNLQTVDLQGTLLFMIQQIAQSIEKVKEDEMGAKQLQGIAGGQLRKNRQAQVPEDKQKIVLPDPGRMLAQYLVHHIKKLFLAALHHVFPVTAAIRHPVRLGKDTKPADKISSFRP